MKLNWHIYQQRTKGEKHTPLLERAISFVEQRGRAIDFGAGGLKDSTFLLRKGFKVTALDATVAHTISNPKFTHLQATFEDFQYEKEKYDLISAQYAFPFVQKGDFPHVWQSLWDSLKPGGIITGNFFGPKDDWKRDPVYGISEGWEGPTDVLFHTKKQIDALLKKYRVIYISEVEYDGPSAVGSEKHWHLISFIARKV